MSDTVNLVKNALSTMYSNAGQQEKKQATQFLEQFQKSTEAWEIVHQILNGSEAEYPIETKLFAAQTLRSKIVYDLPQLPQESLGGLKDSLIQLLINYNNSLKVIRTPLCIALSNLALQYSAWGNAIPEIISTIENQNNPSLVTSLLEFLKILPEELSDVKSTPLTDQEFQIRTQELITSNCTRVLQILSGLSSSSENSKQNSLILDCLNSWIKEIPIEETLSIQPLTTLIFRSLSDDESFEKSIDCLCTILKETRDIEKLEIVEALYQQVIQLKPLLIEQKDDPEIINGLTRLFVEAAESWHVLIAKNPAHFKPLVEILLICSSYDEDLDVVKYTFYFWYMLKQLLTIEKFKDARAQFSEIYTNLIEVIIKHLRYPIGTSDDELFEDKEQEDKFKDFRYEMGDVLKDCCAVIGPVKALTIPLNKVQSVLSLQQQGQQVNWQDIEAPLFSMRAMAKEVSKKENVVLPQIMNILIQLPEHNKIRYAATLVLGRYTEWTAEHPEFLEAQLNYITKGFDNTNIEVITAASHALMYFCQDCSKLLVNYLEQLYTFYNSAASRLDLTSLYEVTDGIAHVVKQQDKSQLYNITSMFMKPTVERLTTYIDSVGTEELYVQIADQVELLSIYASVLVPDNYDDPTSPVSDLIIEIWPTVSQLILKHGNSLKVSERCLKFLKNAVQSFSTYLNPILPSVAECLHNGFQKTSFGCYLWLTGIIVREFSNEYTTEEVKDSVYNFATSQAVEFLKFLNFKDPKQISDLVEDFFRMMLDVVMFYPFKLISGELLKPSIDSALVSLTIDKTEPLMATLHFLIDLFSWGFENPPISFYDVNPEEIKLIIKSFVLENGNNLIKVLLEGLIFHFSIDVQPDASDLFVKILTIDSDINSNASILWLNNAVDSLPNVHEKEKKNLLDSISISLQTKNIRKIRSSVKDFVNWYSRKNVNPRHQFEN